MDRIKYKNEYCKKNYDRVEVLLAKGQKSKLESHCNNLNISISEYIRTLITNDISVNSPIFRDNIKGNEIHELLNKWQVPKKYRHMIETASYSKEDGYFVKLKDGYINSITNTKIIKVKTTTELRLTINKSHKK